MIKNSRKTKLINILATNSKTDKHELIENFLVQKGICGLIEATEEQLEDCCEQLNLL